MSVEVTEIYGVAQIGVFLFVNDAYALVPIDAPKKLEEKIAETLKVDVFRVSVANSRLLGVLVCGNNNGVILPRNVTEDEVKQIKSIASNVAVLEELKETGLGNLVLTNDNGCIVSSLLPDDVVKKISETLGVECVEGSIGGAPFVGSMAVVTNKGLAVPPFVSEEDLRRLENVFKVQAGFLTVNKGRMFLRSGLVANTKGALAGSETTGHELMQIQRIFFSH